jgi:hypothetical protein
VSNPKGKSAAHRTFAKKKNPAIDRLNTRQHGEASLASEGKGYQPEIEHSKLGDAAKKKAEKKRKAAADSLPPHLRLDVMKKAFAHTNEEVFGEEGYDHWRDKQLERGTYRSASDNNRRVAKVGDKKPKGKTVLQKEAEKKYGKGATALDIVKKNIEAKHGKGAIMKTKKEEFVLKSFKQVMEAAPLAAAVPAAAAKVAAVAKGGAVAAKGGAAAVKGAGAAAGATKAVGGAAAKQASVAGTTAGSSSKTAGFGQKLGKAAKEGARDAAVDHVRSKVRDAAGPKDKDDTNEGKEYGLYKGDGKAKGAMKDYLDKKAKKLTDEKKKQKPEYRNNPAFGDASHHSNAKSKNEETLHEISADKLLDASKAADKDRGKKAVAGDRAGAAKRVKQASKFYAASAKKRKQEAKEEYTVTNADKKGNTPAWQGYKSGKKNVKTGKPLYKKADHVKEGHWEYHEKDGLKRFSDFLKEGNPTTRMLGKSKTQQTGNISADRGSDAKKNKESRKGLEKDLKKKGIGYKKGVGEYKYDDGSKGREVSYQTSPAKGMSKRRFGKVMRRLGRKHGQESVITKDKDKPARLHDTESKKPKPSENLGKSKPGKHPKGYGETSGTKVRGKNLSKKTNKPSYHYG